MALLFAGLPINILLINAPQSLFIQRAFGTHDQEDPSSTLCGNNMFIIADPIVTQYFNWGAQLPVGNQIVTGSQVELVTFVKDACGHSHPAWIAIEVRDPSDITIYLSMRHFEEIQAFSINEFGASWTAPEEPGRYQIRAFAIVGFEQSGFGRFAGSEIEVVSPDANT